MVNIKDAVVNLKAWIYIVVLLIAVATTAGTYAKIPTRINNLEDTDQTHDADIKGAYDSVDKLASNLDKYISVQAERAKWQQQHEERQMIMIDEIRKSNGN